MKEAREIYAELQSVTYFTVTDDHLKLMRRAYVSWDDCEFGAPAVDCKRPYGNSDVLADIAEILEVPDDQWKDADGEPFHAAEALIRLHAETAVVLQIALSTGQFSTGRYVREKFGTWRPLI
jgi:hypothetical protein